MAKNIKYIFIFTLFGCSFLYKKSESIESKMVRFKSKNIDLGLLPQIEIADFRYNSRFPASISEKNYGESLKYSNKKLYFLTLYLQYKEFAKYTQEYERSQEVSICPSFHTTLVKYRDNKKLSFQHSQRTYRPIFNSQNLNASIYPELSLSTPEGTSVKQKIKLNPQEDTSKIVLKAVVFHRKKIYRELKELCEYGYSEHYYAYENLITKQITEGVITAHTKGVKILLKTVPFVNELILDSLKSSSRKVNREIASVSDREDPFYYQALVQRFKAHWIKKYFQIIAERRLGKQ